MGQYFNPVIVDPTGRPLAALNPATYGAGPKLSTHTRADCPLMAAVEILLTLDGGARLVWAGDYEDPDDDQDALYWLVEPQHFVRFAGLIDPDEPVTPNAEAPTALPAHRYICNADKRQYLDNRVLPTMRGRMGLRSVVRHDVRRHTAVTFICKLQKCN